MLLFIDYLLILFTSLLLNSKLCIYANIREGIPMSYRNKSLVCDTSEEFIIQRWGNGVKLMPPNQTNTGHTLHGLIQQRKNISVGEVFKLPFNVYVLSPISEIQNSNQMMIDTNGFLSKKNAIGKTVFKVFKKESAQHCINNDQEVMKYNQIKIVDEPLLRLDHIDYYSTSVKFPLYNEINKIVGVFGLSVLVSNGSTQPSQHHISLLEQTRLLYPSLSPLFENLPPEGLTIGDVYLTKRESQCLYYLIRGKTAKGISAIMGISSRTVESYIMKLKFKLKVNFTCELIEKAIAHFSSS